MKTFAKLFALLAIFSIGFTSCGDDKEDPTTPNIELKGEFTETENNYVGIFLVTCDAPAKIKNVTAEYVYNNGESKLSVSKDNISTAKTDQAWTVTITFPKSVSTAAVEKLTVTATTDDDGNRAKSFNTPTTPVPPVIEYTVTKVTVEAGKTYGYKQGETTGTFEVVSATAGAVEVKIAGQSVVLLSDAGNSYMSTSFAGMNFATAKEDATKVLFCLLSESTTIASGTEAASADIKDNAIETKFTAKAIEE